MLGAKRRKYYEEFKTETVRLAREKERDFLRRAAVCIRDGQPEYARELLSADALRRFGCFDAAKVQCLLEKIRRNPALGHKDNMAFVGILSTQARHYLFIERYAETFFDRAGTSAGTYKVSTGVTS